MTQTTGKASSNKTGNKRNVPVKGKRNSQKVNRNAKGVKSKMPAQMLTQKMVPK